MVTRLYFHAQGNGLANLPTTEQSSLTSDKDANPQSQSHSMNTTIGTGQTGILCRSNATASLQRNYFGCFVSPPLSGVSSITAQTWTYNFSGTEGSTNANFPVAGASQVVRVTCYVWRPGTGKLGNIFDGNSAATLTEAAGQQCYTTTFSGALVSSVANGDVIIFEVWFELTQATATAANNQFFYDGATVTLTAGAVTNHATFIETPQNLTFGTEVLNPRLYFHAASSVLSNLPTTDQSALTADVSVDAFTTNRNMNTTKGTSQTSLAATSLAQTAQQNIYFTRFVSDALSGISSIPAGQWVYNFAASESNTSANFPGSSIGDSVRVTCYVWRPSSQTKLGTILEGVTLSVITEPAASTEGSETADFAGSAVAVSDGDVIIFEVWFQITQGAATSYTDTFYFDGATVTLNPPLATVTVSNHAAYLECPSLLTFSAPVGGTNYNRALPTETVSISETLARQSVNSRALTAETVSTSESLARLATHPRLMNTETTVIGETLQRTFGSSRSLATETVTVSETNSKTITNSRPLATETVPITESIQTTRGFIRTLTTETIAIGESLARVFNGQRTLPTETVVIASGTLARAYAAIRSLAAETTAISETLVRLSTVTRALATETVTITSGTVARLLGASRQLAAETVAISETIARLFTGSRLMATQTTTISENLATLYTPAPPAGTFERQMPLETVAITESLNRVVTNSRAVTPEITTVAESLNKVYSTTRALNVETVSITGTLTRTYNSARALPAEIVSVLDVSLNRLYGATRTIQETVIATETLNRFYNATRALSPETVSIFETLETLVGVAGNAFVRVLQDTVTISETLARRFNGIRAITETITITEHLQIPAPPTPTPTPSPILQPPPIPVGPPKVETVVPKNLRQISKDLQPYPEPRAPHKRTSDKDESQTPETSTLKTTMTNGPFKNFFGNIIGMLRKKRDPDLEF